MVCSHILTAVKEVQNVIFKKAYKLAVIEIKMFLHGQEKQKHYFSTVKLKFHRL